MSAPNLDMKFENQAWAEAEHPRLDSNRVDVTTALEVDLGVTMGRYKSVIAEICWHYPRGAYFVSFSLYARPREPPKSLTDSCFGYTRFGPPAWTELRQVITYLAKMGYHVYAPAREVAHGVDLEKA